MFRLLPTRRLILIPALVALMLLAHPYEGLRHDGVLYFAQVLRQSRVPGLGADLFFAGGSQDSFSIYAPLIAPLYALLGQTATHMGLLLLCWLAMGSAVLALLRRLVPEPTAQYWGLLAFAVLSPVYGGGWVFGYTEPFLTARTLAEPLLLWGLVGLLDRRWYRMAGLLGTAACLHPLMALPVIAITWCYLVMIDRRWLAWLALIPVALAAGLAGLRPWDGLLKVYDPYWWALIETGSRQLLLQNWRQQELLVLALDLSVLTWVARLRPSGIERQLLLAVLVASLLLMLVAAVGTDGLRSVLVTQLQLWRVHWVSHLLAQALAPWLLLQLWRRGGLWCGSACALILALLSAHIGTAHGPETLALWALTALAAWRAGPVSAFTRWLVIAGIIGCILGMSAYQLDALVTELQWQSPATALQQSFTRLMAFPTVAAALFACIWALSRRGGAGGAAALAVSLALVGAAAATWDQRTDLAREVESPRDVPHPFQARLPHGASVYWPGQAPAVWGLLERPSHFARNQGAGVLFNRHTGLMFGPRREAYRLILQDHEKCQQAAKLSRDGDALRQCDMPAAERLNTLCRQFDRPDFLVLPGRLQATPLATWQPPVVREPAQRLALYACAQLAADIP